jgi:hypothetical protein
LGVTRAESLVVIRTNTRLGVCHLSRVYRYLSFDRLVRVAGFSSLNEIVGNTFLKPHKAYRFFLCEHWFDAKVHRMKRLPEWCGVIHD